VFQPLKFTNSGHIFIDPSDDPELIASLLDPISYGEEFCVALDLSPPFIARLMAAGFLVMSILDQEGAVILLPEMHLERSTLFFDQLHEGRTLRRLIPRFELKVDGLGSGSGDFHRILERCAQVHGEDWLTAPLRRSFHALYRSGPPEEPGPGAARMISFGLYCRGRLAAGEFGALAGRVYTSYSGYRDEDSAGSVQLALTGRWLRDSGFAFWDLGMLLPYKERLGAQSLCRAEFLERFRSARQGIL
jgi:Leu/Phe-tRNA-protein transferase